MCLISCPASLLTMEQGYTKKNLISLSATVVNVSQWDSFWIANWQQHWTSLSHPPSILSSLSLPPTYSLRSRLKVPYSCYHLTLPYFLRYHLPLPTFFALALPFHTLTITSPCLLSSLLPHSSILLLSPHPDLLSLLSPPLPTLSSLASHFHALSITSLCPSLFVITSTWILSSLSPHPSFAANHLGNIHHFTSFHSILGPRYRCASPTWAL